MALINCKECGTEVSTTAKACPKCGARVPKTKWWLWAPLGLGAAFLTMGAVIGSSPQGQERSRARAAIDLCWEEQERKSLDSGSQRFIAGACEMMESEFRNKYGVNP